MRDRTQRTNQSSELWRAATARLDRPRGRVLLALAAAAALIAGPFLPAPSAQAVSYTFFLDSEDVTATAKDAKIGDGVCATAAGTCTMRAALEESNALNLPAGAILITVADGMTGNINPVASGYQVMLASAVSQQDSTAHFVITAPVTIDMRGQGTLEALTDSGGALFYVNSPKVTFLNMTQVLSGESSFVMGPLADGVTIDGGSSITQKNYGPERFVVLREGAKNITIKNYRLQGFYDSPGATGLFYVNAQNNTPIQNIVVDNVDVTYPVGGSCHGTDGSGCRTTLLEIQPRNQNVVMDGFTFTNSFVSNLGSQNAFPFATSSSPSASAKVSNIVITDNEFINMQGRVAVATDAFIMLPSGPMAGTNEITGNKIVRATGGQNYAVSWYGNAASGSAGKLRIAHNYFNGYLGSSIYLQGTGDVNVEQNTFGIRSASQLRPGLAEEYRDGTSSLLDNYTNANGKVYTWYPAAAAAVLTTEAPLGSVPVVSPLTAEVPVCVAALDVTAPTTAPLPASTVDLDVYWTQDRTAEVYLGRASQLTGAGAKLLVELPVGPQQVPSTVVGSTESVTIVNAVTGVPGGFLRVQTIGAETGQSSQYSRLMAISGNCRPALTIEQAADQNDPTLARDLHYTVTSSLPLDPASVTPEVIELTAAAVPGTLAADLLNPRTVSVTPVTGTSDRKFEVIARVDDAAKVTVAIAADRVASVGGLTNPAAATSTDGSITFTNPIQAKPGSFTLVTGEPDGKQYDFRIAAGAPKPKADLQFTAVPDQSAADHQVALSSLTAVLAAGETTSERIRVTAGAGDVPANTPVQVTHTVTSEDPNFDGLVVNNLLVRLFSTDPAVNITKRAFTGVNDMTSPATILATGVEALAGARLTDGEAVCFVYEVLNTSADAWTTTLTDVTVTDSDSRLGTSGVIGTVASLAAGQSTRLSACGTLIAEDTTVSDTR